ncbi:hypothetical protein [Longimicrobium sp.]|jgi:hypothetical protein|uniref:hypothetical protein n=1 Tax=Longimicrobium sp. TaxID=2029185 RepID=UPI002ED9355C
MKRPFSVPNQAELKQALWDAAVDYHVALLLRSAANERYGPPYDAQGREQVVSALVRYNAASGRVQEAVQSAMTAGVLYRDVADGSYFLRVDGVFQTRRKRWVTAGDDGHRN